MYISEYFKTPIWSEHKPEFVNSSNKASDKYIKEARKNQKAYIKQSGDFGTSYHSTPLTQDNDFMRFKKLCWSKILGIFRPSWLRYETIYTHIF